MVAGKRMTKAQIMSELAGTGICLVAALLAWALIPGGGIRAAAWTYFWVALAQLPYLAWVSIATVLQLSISWNNWPG